MVEMHMPLISIAMLKRRSTTKFGAEGREYTKTKSLVMLLIASPTSDCSCPLHLPKSSSSVAKIHQ